MARRRNSLGWLAAAAALVPALAYAWPVDVVVDLEAGREHFEHPVTVAFAEVEDPKVATAEVLPSGELLLTGVSPGRTLMLLYAEGKFAVWRLRVAAKGAKVKPVPGDAELAAAKKACPGLKTGEGSEDAALAGFVRDEACREALLSLFQTDAFNARQLDLTFDLAALQSQLKSLLQGLKAATASKVDASYHGAGLVLEGKLSEADHHKVLWEVFRRSVGRAPLDDELEVAPADAGSATSATKGPP